MSCFLNFEKKICWITPPKNACSTLKSWFWYCETNQEISSEQLAQNKPTLLMNERIQNTNYNLNEFKFYIIYRNIYEKFYSYLNNVVYHRLTKKDLFINDNYWVNFLKVYKENNNNNELTLNENIENFIKVIIKININSIQEIDPHIYTQYRHIRDYILFLNNNQINPEKRTDLFDNIKDKIQFVTIDDMNFIKKTLECAYEKKIYLESKNVSIIKNNKNIQQINDIKLKDIPEFKLQLLDNYKFKNYIDKLYEYDIFYFQSFDINIKDTSKFDILRIRNELNNVEKQLDDNELLYIYNKYKSLENLNQELENFHYIAFKYKNSIDFKKMSKIQLFEHYLKIKNNKNNNYVISFKNLKKDFDINSYIKLNKDMNKYNDIEQVYLHYENHGFYENRKYK